MLDVIALASIVVLLGMALLYVHGCERLKGKGHDS